MDPYAAALGVLPNPPARWSMPPPGADVRDNPGPLLAQSQQTQANVLADIHKTGAQTATFNGMPLEATAPNMAMVAAAPDPYAAALGVSTAKFAGSADSTNQPGPPASPTIPQSDDPGAQARLQADWEAQQAQKKADGPASWWDKPWAAMQAGLNTADAMTGGTIPALRVPDQLRTTQGNSMTGDVGDFMQANGPAVMGLGPEMEAVGGILSKAVRAKINPSIEVRPSYAPLDNSPEALAAQGFTAPAKTLSDATPEVQKAFADAQAAGQPIDPVHAARIIEADTLPVPIKQTEGQVTGDPTQISLERNGRAGVAPTVTPAQFQAQEQALSANIDAIKAKVAPDLPTTDPTTLGQIGVDAYKKMDAPIQADINAKYQALRDANGGQFPVDAPALLQNIKTALGKELLTGDAPASQMNALQTLADQGSMTMEQFLSLRRNLGNVARTAADGNARMAASTMIQELERLPLSGGAADLQPLADQARSAAKARFDAIKADPAYKAAVDDSTPIGETSPVADTFMNKYVLGRGAPLANVKTMRANLANDPEALQAIGAAQVENLRAGAKGSAGTGNFSQAGFNRAMAAQGPQKLAETLGPEAASTARALGNVAQRVQAQPAGSFVNNSNTLVGALSSGAIGAARSALAIKTGGLSEGAIGIGKTVLGSRAAAKAAERATGPAAGLTRLSEIGKR